MDRNRQDAPDDRFMRIVEEVIRKRRKLLEELAKY